MPHFPTPSPNAKPRGLPGSNARSLPGGWPSCRRLRPGTQRAFSVTTWRPRPMASGPSRTEKEAPGQSAHGTPELGVCPHGLRVRMLDGGRSGPCLRSRPRTPQEALVVYARSAPPGTTQPRVQVSKRPSLMPEPPQPRRRPRPTEPPRGHDHPTFRASELRKASRAHSDP